MHKKTTKIMMAACAVIFLGMISCANKKAPENAYDSLGQDTVLADSGLTEDTSAALDSALAEAADSIKDDAKPGADGYIVTPSGLKYKVLKKGTGATPTASDIVEVNYEGKLVDGTVFDSSYQRGESIQFPLNRVIKGWTEGLQLMQEGAEYEFYIPYQLAYGEQGTPGGPIPPKSDLIFKVELIKVNK